MHESRRNGLSFQVHLWYYPGDCASDVDVAAAVQQASSTGSGPEARMKEVLRLRETVHTQWGTFKTRYRVAKWLHAKLKDLGSNALMNGWVHPDYDSKSTQTAAAPGPADAEKDAPSVTAAKGTVGQAKPDVSKYAEETGNGQPATLHWKSIVEAASSWEAGHVDVTFVNMVGTPLVLLHGSEAGWSKPAELPNNGLLHPKESFTAKSHEREMWAAEAEDGSQFGPWEIDISNGVVQDIVINLASSRTQQPIGGGGGGGGSAEKGGQESENDAQAKLDVAKVALKLNPCGSHVGCTEVLGDFVLDTFLKFDVDKLIDLGITSAMDLLIFAHSGKGGGGETSHLDRSGMCVATLPPSASSL